MMELKMPRIIDCSMTGCAYNSDSLCHAMAITVGSKSPMCDTFMKRARKGGVKEINGSVGACKIDNCAFNESLECMADGIHVGMHAGHAECETFKAQ